MKSRKLLIANIVAAMAAYGSIMFMWFSFYRLGWMTTWDSLLLDKRHLSELARIMQDIGHLVRQNMVFSGAVITLAFFVVLSIFIINRYKRNRGLLTQNAAIATAMISLFLASILIRVIWYLGYYQPVLSGISKIR